MPPSVQHAPDALRELPSWSTQLAPDNHLTKLFRLLFKEQFAKQRVAIRVVESKSLKVGKSLKIGKNRIKSEKSDLISF